MLDTCVWPAGTALNSGSDWYKAGAKAAGGGMVTTGPYSWSLRPNYLGDWLRSAEARWMDDALLTCIHSTYEQAVANSGMRCRMCRGTLD